MLDLDSVTWGGVPGGVPGSGRASDFGLMLANLSAVTANYRKAGVGRFVLASFIRTEGERDTVRDTPMMPPRVVRLTVPPGIDPVACVAVSGR
ncbi:MAG TPA: hypothetical protein VFQ44_20905 [Streptosporangiaceae bacterium]|nr:hypothetical protein [Streptosporangiaceae bacterium]